MVTLERSWMRLVARSARIPVPRIVEAGLVTVTRTGDLASSSSGNMFSCSVFIRSEEHTSELQSLMRSSYAVFCLKKKKITTKKMQNRIESDMNDNKKESKTQ